MKKIIILSIITLLFLTSCLFFSRIAESTPNPIPPSPTPVQEITSTPAPDIGFENGLMPEYQSALKELKDASLYTIELKISDDLFHIIGSEEVRYTNNEDVNLDEVQLRLFPNILGGEMTVSDVKVHGNAVTPKYKLNNSLLILPLKEPLQPKQSLTLSMDFSVVIPKSVELNYGVQASFEDVLALAHAYPMIAVYDDEGWNSEIPPQSGDVTYADMSFFLVTVDAPKDVTVVVSGREISRQDNGNRQQIKAEAGPVRDFYLAASPVYKVFTKESNGVTLRFYTRGNLQKGAEYALDVAARSIAVYDKRYAPYPYTELDFVSTPTYALGIEYPGMIAITEWIVDPNNGYLEATIAHEVGHQWFYNLVGNDQLDEPWLDESLTQFITQQYFTDEYGKAGSEGFRQDIAGRWAYINNNPIPVGLPVKDYSDAEYSGIVYGRGALFFEALQEKMGVEAFDEFMKGYTTENAWGISTAEVLRTQAEGYCKCDLSALFGEWIYP